MTTGIIAPIQALRGIAASAVLLWHAGRYFGTDSAALARVLQPGAVMGVDLFFLVSGFIMVHATRDSDGSPRYVAEFLVKRAARIWPLWLIALAALLAVLGDTTYFTDAARREWLLRSLMFLPTAGVTADVPPIYGAPVLGVGWTLNYEMYFYAFFGLSMLAARWRWVVFSFWVIASVLLFPLLGGKLDATRWFDFFAADRNYHYAIQYFDLATNPLVLLFVAGALIGLMHHSPLPLLRRRGVALALVGVSSAAVAAQFALAFRPYHGVSQWGITLIPLLMTVSLASRSFELRVPRWLSWLGDISFSLYLLHPIVLTAVFAVIRDYRFAPLAAIVGVLLSVAIAALSHRWIERGLSDALRNWALARMGSKPDRAASRVPAISSPLTRSST